MGYNERYKTIVRYKNENLLQSGSLIGEKEIAKKAGMVCAQYGKGKIAVIGFKAQNRDQADGTFKLLFIIKSYKYHVILRKSIPQQFQAFRNSNFR